MTEDQIVKLSEDILAKLETLGDDDCCSDEVLKGLLDADLYAKVAFESLTDEQIAALKAEDMSWEVDGFAEGLLDKVLTTKERKRLPASTFCGPDRSFPVPDKAHVRNALARLGQGFPKGASAATRARIRSCVLRRAKALGVDASEGSGKGKAKDSDRSDAAERIKSLEKELADSKGACSRLSAELTDAIKERDELLDRFHKTTALKVLELRKSLQKPDVVNLTDEETVSYVAKLVARSADSLNDSIADLELELSALADTSSQGAPQDSDAGAEGDNADADNSADAGDADDSAGGTTPAEDPNHLQDSQQGAGDAQDASTKPKDRPSRPMSNIEKIRLMIGEDE